MCAHLLTVQNFPELFQQLHSDFATAQPRQEFLGRIADLTSMLIRSSSQGEHKRFVVAAARKNTDSN